MCVLHLFYFPRAANSINWSAHCWDWVSFKTHWMSCKLGFLGLQNSWKAAGQSALTCRRVKSNWPNTRFVVAHINQYIVSSISHLGLHYAAKLLEGCFSGQKLVERLKVTKTLHIESLKVATT